MRATIANAILFALLGAAPLLAQAPLLQLSAPQAGPHGWQVTITNRYRSPATAYVIDIINPDGSIRHTPGAPLARHIEDSIPGPVKSRTVLAAGQSRSLGFGSARWTDIAYQDTAVIYADGATAGDPALIAHLLRVRQAEAGDIAQVLPLLATAQNNPALNLAAFRQSFVQRASAHEAAVGDHLAPPTDRVCRSVLVNLDQPQNTSLKATLWGLQEMFTRWLAQLQAGKPQPPLANP